MTEQNRHILYKIKPALANNQIADAIDVEVANTQMTGSLADSGTAQEALRRIDNTGLGAPEREVNGSFFCTYSEGSENTNTWYGGRQNVNIRVNPTANGQYTFRMPSSSDMTSLFDDLSNRNLGENYTLTITYTGGNTGFVNRNRLNITNASVSNGFPQGTFPTVLAQGQSATFRLTRVGGVTRSWERVSFQQAVNPAPTLGEVVLQNLGWNNTDGSLLPSGSMVLKGYAFPVVGSVQNDGKLRQGLIDAGVSDRLIYNGDYVVWTADSFTSWANGDDWFVLPRNQLESISREESNFLAQTSEIDNRVDIGSVSAMTADALVWLSENPLVEAPFLNPSADTNNPRSGNDYPYIGGRENRNGQLMFQSSSNRFNNYLTIGITPNFISSHPESTIDIVVRDVDGNEVERLNLDSDFTFVDNDTFTNSTVRHYQRSTSFNYSFLETIDIVLTQVQDHYRINPNTVDVTSNVSNLAENQLSPDVREKLNKTPESVNITEPVPAELLAKVFVTHNNAASDARFLSATDTTTYPSQLSDFQQVSVNNPRFLSSGTILFVAVPEPDNYALLNTSADTMVALDQSEPNVEVIESFTDSGVSWFVYRINPAVDGNRYEVVRVTTEQKLAIINRLDLLEEHVASIENELNDIPDAVLNVLENSVTITEQNNPVLNPSAFNNSLGNNGTQKVYIEKTPQTPSSGSLNSDAFSETTGLPRARRKLLYLNENHVFQNGDFVTAFDGVSNTQTLITHIQGQLFAKVFVPAQPASTTNVTVYPAPSNLVSGAGIWITIPALTFTNGVPVPVADEVFFTRNIPTSPVNLTIQYRGHANGNIFDAGTTTLAGVGGSSDVSKTVTISDGSEVVTLEIRYTASTRQIRTSITERVNAGLPTVNDVQVILSYSETRTIPATNSSRRDVLLQSNVVSGQPLVLAFKPSDTDNLIVVSKDREIDTNLSYTGLFGSGDAGNLTVFSEQAGFYDYQNITPINSTVQLLTSHAGEQNYGLFDTTYNHETVVQLLTQLTVQDSSGTLRNVGDVLTDLLTRVTNLEN